MRKEAVRFSSSPGNELPIDELNIQEDHYTITATTTTTESLRGRETVSQDESPIFFRSVVFSPEVPIRLDYHGKSVNMDQVHQNYNNYYLKCLPTIEHNLCWFIGRQTFVEMMICSFLEGKITQIIRLFLKMNHYLEERSLYCSEKQTQTFIYFTIAQI